MNIIDLTHSLNNSSPVFPGDPQPVFRPFASLSSDGFRETYICFGSHLGTHIDAPAHMLAEGKTLDNFLLDAFWGDALIINIEDRESIDSKIIYKYKDEIQKVNFVLFNTGWCRLWGNSSYFDKFPVFTDKAIDYLLNFNLKGIGIDTISVDPPGDECYTNHLKILSKEMFIVENLNFPGNLNLKEGKFSCFPLYYEKADASPVRAVFYY